MIGDVKLNMIYNEDCYEFMKKLPDNSVSLILTDPPYNLGSQYTIDREGHYNLRGKGSDFGNKWDVMGGRWWDKFFQEASRILKSNGYFVMFTIDRHADLWSHYARRNNLIPQQKLYWLFLDNFPKAYDVSKALDKDAGCEREVVIEANKNKGVDRSKSVLKGLGDNYSITKPCSELGKKYDGYKFSIAPFKQVMEEILVMRKMEFEDMPIVKQVRRYEDDIHPIGGMHLPIMKINPPITDDYVPTKYLPQMFIQEGMGEHIREAIGSTAGAKFMELIPEIEFTDLDYYYFYKSKTKDRNIVEDGAMHVTVKPLALISRILDLFILPDRDSMVVYDSFAGSGTVPQACKDKNIKFIATELDPDYFKVGVRRLEETQQSLFGG